MSWQLAKSSWQGEEGRKLAKSSWQMILKRISIDKKWLRSEFYASIFYSKFNKYCQLPTALCQLLTLDLRFPTANCLLLFAYCQLPTAPCQLTS